ncbi:MAG: glycosyltransferase, partial [Candidatus Pacebacteria bacterium]|nr:glycosyltransferase [Candidatus Paceibacterota bacterium]
DDYYIGPDSLEKAVKAMDLTSNKFYYFTMFLENAEGHRKIQKYHFNKINYWKLFYSAYVPHPTLVISKKQYQTVGLFDESFKITGDHDFILRLCRKYQGQFVDWPLTVMKQGGISGRNNKVTFAEFKRATIKNGLPAWLAEILFRFKVLKLRFTKKF